MAQTVATKEKEEEPFVISIQKGSKRKFKDTRYITWGSRSAASIKNLKSILTRQQLEQCSTEYINNGMLRSVVDRSAYMIQGDRSSFVVEANEEITATASPQELKNLHKTLIEDEGIKELRKKVIRCNKRVQLHDRIDKLLHSTLLFGRNALQISRFPESEDWPMYGEPQSLKHLSSLRITEANMNRETYEFEGFLYDYGRNMGERFIKAIDLIPAFWDDNNVQDNTNYSGTSPAWTVLSAAQSIDILLDEDIPESVRQVWAKFGIIFAGTSKKAIIGEMKDQLEASTWFIHNQKELSAQVLDLKSSLIELPDMVTALSKYICQSMSIPLFLVFEDTANFATAQEVMQVYKNGMLKRHRTWLQGILEKYWYDALLADHLGIAVEDIISADWKIKATFPDIDFSQRKAIIEGDVMLLDRGVITKAELAKDIGRDDIEQRILEEELDTEIKKRDGIIQDQAKQLEDMKRQLGGSFGAPMSNNLLQIAAQRQQGQAKNNNNNGNAEKNE